MGEAGGGPMAAAARTVPVWSTTEPFALSEPLHSGHNRNITQLNAEARQVLDVVGVPVLDGFKLTLERLSTLKPRPTPDHSLLFTDRLPLNTIPALRLHMSAELLTGHKALPQGSDLLLDTHCAI